MSYELNGFKWGTPTQGTESGVIYWNADLSTGLTIDPGYNAGQFQTSLASAFQAWEDVAAIDFEYVASSSAADIEVSMGPLSGSTVGLATTSFSVLPGLDRAFAGDILLDSLESWNPFTDFYAVALHEIGHVLGLEHVVDTAQIMNSFVSATNLGSGDILGVQTLYGTDAGDVSVAPPAPAPAPSAPSAPPTASSPPATPIDDDPPVVNVAATDDDGPSGIGGIFQWFFDLLSGLFGGGDDDDGTTVATATGTSSHSVYLAEDFGLADVVPIVGTYDDTMPEEGADWDIYEDDPITIF